MGLRSLLRIAGVVFVSLCSLATPANGRLCSGSTKTEANSENVTAAVIRKDDAFVILAKALTFRDDGLVDMKDLDMAYVQEVQGTDQLAVYEERGKYWGRVKGRKLLPQRQPFSVGYPKDLQLTRATASRQLRWLGQSTDGLAYGSGEFALTDRCSDCEDVLLQINATLPGLNATVYLISANESLIGPGTADLFGQFQIVEATYNAKTQVLSIEFDQEMPTEAADEVEVAAASGDAVFALLLQDWDDYAKPGYETRQVLWGGVSTKAPT